MNNANGMYSTVLGGQKMTLIASNTIGFNGSSTEWTVTKSSVQVSWVCLWVLVLLIQIHY